MSTRFECECIGIVRAVGPYHPHAVIRCLASVSAFHRDGSGAAAHSGVFDKITGICGQGELAHGSLRYADYDCLPPAGTELVAAGAGVHAA